MNNRPQRIHLSRSRGAKLPPGTVVVSRPSRWGNPFNWQECQGILDSTKKANACIEFKRWLDGKYGGYLPERRAWILSHLHLIREAKYIACWCKKDENCHGDILIELCGTLHKVS